MAIFDWNETNTAMLKKLWSEGHSASMIACRLGNPSRSAVIGKVHRLGLSGRAFRSYPSVTARRKKPPQPAKPRVRFPIHEVLPPLPETDTPKGPLVMFADLEPHHCRGTYGDPKQDNFGFCGCPVVPLTSYCEEHLRRYYQMGTAPKRAHKPTMPARLSHRIASPVDVTDREDVFA